MPESPSTYRVLGSLRDPALPTNSPLITTPSARFIDGNSERLQNVFNDDNVPISAVTDFACPICSESMITLEQLNQHLDDAHADGPDGSDIALSPNSAVLASSPSPHGAGSPSFLNGTLTKWIRNGLEASSVKLGLEAGYLSPERQRRGLVGSLAQTSPARRNIKLDMLDNNRGFSMRDSEDAAPSLPTYNEASTSLPTGVPSSKRISRTHWQQPSSSGHDLCLHPGCSLVLNIKNGKVNCRKCGHLFCNLHTHFRVRLKNGGKDSGPQYEPLQDGIWSRVCQECHDLKPELTTPEEATSNNQTETFMLARAKFSEIREIERSRIQKHLIKEVNLLAEYYVSVKHEGTALLWNTIKGNNKWTPEYILEQQIQIIGRQNWLQNQDVKFCPLCYSKFNLLTRRHHCRTCGRIVCDGTLNDKGLLCLMDVPGGVFLERLPHLNYAPVVKENFEELRNADELFRFRVCLDCKNLLLYRVKRDVETNDEFRDVLELLETILACKGRIVHLLDRFHILVKNEEPNTNKIRIKLMGCVREFESLAADFRKRFFVKVSLENHTKAAHSGPGVVKPYPSFPPDIQMTVNNIYLGSILFLQRTLTEIKSSSQALREQDEEVIEQQRGESIPQKEDSKVPKLTKREIRTLRDELMVMNEQSFIVENLIRTATKERRFDEILSLNDNKKELEGRIRQLEEQLGEHAF